jgi:preprotein translocase subunit SecG
MAVLAIVINLFFLPGQTTKEQRESIIQNSGQQIPQQGTLPQQLPQSNQQQQPNQ